MNVAAILNPAAGNGAAFKLWNSLRPDPAIHVWRTERSGHAAQLARLAAQRGFERIVVAGGDGTLSEVVDGLCRGPRKSIPSIGVLPLGRGCDFIRNLKLGRRVGVRVLNMNH